MFKEFLEKLRANRPQPKPLTIRVKDEKTGELKTIELTQENVDKLLAEKRKR